MTAAANDQDPEQVLARFAPETDQAWATLFPDPEERKQWRRKFRSAVTAEPWRDAGIDPGAASGWSKRFEAHEAAVWQNAGFERYGDAWGWHASGFTPESSAAWRAAQITPAAAANWIAGGVDSPAGVSRWTDRKLSAHLFRAWRTAGFSPANIEAWLTAGVREHRVAQSWLNRGFTLESAVPWMALGFNGGVSRQWLDAGYRVADAVWWRERFDETDLAPGRLRRAARAGLTVENIDDWQSALTGCPQAKRLNSWIPVPFQLALEEVATLVAGSVDPIDMYRWHSRDRSKVTRCAQAAAMALDGGEPCSVAHRRLLRFHRLPSRDQWTRLFGDRWADAKLLRVHQSQGSNASAWALVTSRGDPAIDFVKEPHLFPNFMLMGRKSEYISVAAMFQDPEFMDASGAILLIPSPHDPENGADVDLTVDWAPPPRPAG